MLSLSLLLLFLLMQHYSSFELGNLFATLKQCALQLYGSQTYQHTNVSVTRSF